MGRGVKNAGRSPAGHQTAASLGAKERVAPSPMPVAGRGRGYAVPGRGYPAPERGRCRYFRGPGTCKFQEDCKFSHADPDGVASQRRSSPGSASSGGRADSGRSGNGYFHSSSVWGVERWLATLIQKESGAEVLSTIATSTQQLRDLLGFGAWTSKSDKIDDIVDKLLQVLCRRDLQDPLFKDQYCGLFMELQAADSLWQKLESLVSRSSQIHEGRLSDICAVVERLLDLFFDSHRKVVCLVENLEIRVKDGFSPELQSRVLKLVKLRKEARERSEKKAAGPTAAPKAAQSAVLRPEDLARFREVSVVPDGLSFLQNMTSGHLRPNRVDGSEWQGPDDYLSTHWNLLREDALRPLCDRLAAYSQGQDVSDRDREVCVYTNVVVGGIQLNPHGITYRVNFRPPARKIDWRRSKRLLTGSLLALSSDRFQNEVLWATVASRDADLLAKSTQIDLDFMPGSERALTRLGRVYVAVESKTFFAAYSHMLKVLQSIKTLPFQEVLLRRTVHSEEVLQGALNPASFRHSTKPPKCS